jgi:hypothetical protein
MAVAHTRRLLALGLLLAGSAAAARSWAQGAGPFAPPEGETHSPPGRPRPPQPLRPQQHGPSAACPPPPPPQQERFTQDGWLASIGDGSPDATIDPNGGNWAVKGAVVTAGDQHMLIRGRLGVGEFTPGFAVNVSRESDGAPTDGVTRTTVKVDKLENRPIRLLVGGQEIGRITPTQFAAGFEFRMPGTEGPDTVPAASLLDPLKKGGVPVKASIEIDGRDLVFFDATPGPVGAVMDEMNRRAAVQRANRPKPDPNCCFLTTACCEAIGLPDDCFELATLRRYRDEVLAHMPGGPREIERYYALAPAILRAMRERGRERALLQLYFSRILPCVLLARLGAARLTRRLYRDMIARLCRRYLAEADGGACPAEGHCAPRL